MSEPARAIPIDQIPDFEGQPVSTSKMKIISAAALEVDGAAFRIDDIVRVVVEARVSQVHHNVNERTGNLERVHTARPLTVEVAPWNPEDPADFGIVRG